MLGVDSEGAIFGKHLIESEDQMRQFGFLLGQELKAGDLLVLKGPLGAGKTTLTQGIGGALGITEITSPTFIIAREHAGPIPFIHVDLYRLLGSDTAQFEFDDLDLQSQRESAIIVMEWGSDLAPRLGEGYIFIEINILENFQEGEESRELLVERR
ncbi:MAG: tRNA (adenosine(37)-N6)-threonylcarbamoyltransferase complex ATPase subunit type 1 TsaE [Actinobacteria bacterium]|jgi:tRNA threonylcarbamoyladenosine biosynthesis protein TsaE|nr:tRNA (adenosine(37)-N6)-threonylcarbamoyltransferase complex ATPase subunit type 1 TsaE [Actinomycetota bacterium]